MPAVENPGYGGYEYEEVIEGVLIEVARTRVGEHQPVGPSYIGSWDGCVGGQLVSLMDYTPMTHAETAQHFYKTWGGHPDVKRSS